MSEEVPKVSEKRKQEYRRFLPGNEYRQMVTELDAKSKEWAEVMWALNRIRAGMGTSAEKVSYEDLATMVLKRLAETR